MPHVDVEIFTIIRQRTSRRYRPRCWVFTRHCSGPSAGCTVTEDLPQFVRRDLVTGLIRGVLHHAGELDLQPARQVEVVVGLHDVRHAALAGLRVDPDHGLIAAADVMGIDRQIGRFPRDFVDALAGLLRPLAQRQFLLDCILGEPRSGEDQVPA